MNNYVIMTDSGCDISPDKLSEWGVRCIDFTFKNTEEAQIYTNRDMPVSAFYKYMENGAVFQTSAINPEEFKKAFEEELKLGNDVLYIGLSSGLSTTANCAVIAAQELSKEYTDHKIVTVDSLCASAGEGLLLYFAVEKKKAGYSLDDLASYVSETASQICHWFTVDDLKYLKRGGRISAAAAFAATVLDIKPVLHVDDEGHLINMSKMRGRRQAIKALEQKYELLARDPQNGIYFISHGRCPEDAALLESLISQKFGHGAGMIAEIGPVIGSHSGPGTLALFFIGKAR